MRFVLLLVAASAALAQDCTSNANPCEARECGTVHAGCGKIVSCGTCASITQTCLASGHCRSMLPTPADVADAADDAARALWDVAADGSSVATNSGAALGAGASFLRWVSSQELVSDAGTVFKASAKCGAASAGAVGLGVRLGQAQENDGLWVGAQCSATGKAAAAAHLTVDGVQSELPLGDVAWNADAPNALSLSFAVTKAHVEVNATINGVALKTVAVPIAGMPDPGALFFAAAGPANVFSGVGVSTAQAFDVAAPDCLELSALRDNIARVVGLAAADIGVEQTSGTATCGDAFRVSLRDVAPKAARRQVAEGGVLAASVGAAFEQMVASNALDLAGFSLTQPLPVVAELSASATVFALPAAAAGAGLALSAGAIIGIAVGGAAGLAVVGTGVAVAVKVARSSSSSPPAAREEPAEMTTTRKMSAAKAGGIDVMGNTGGEVHSSITNRAAPIALA